MALWKNSCCFYKFRSCYNTSIKKLFWYHRRDSVSGILMDLCLPSADNVFMFFCLHDCVLCLVITLYSGLILSVYARFSFFFYVCRGVFCCLILFSMDSVSNKFGLTDGRL